MIQADLFTLQEMILRIDAYINSRTPIRDEDLVALERDIAQLKTRYGK
jgi:hypothetical protein